MTGRPIPPEVTGRIADYVFAGNKIAAVKLYREYSDDGLKESYDFIKAMEAELRVREPDKFAARPAGGNGCLGILALCGLGILAVLLAVWVSRDENRASVAQWWTALTRSGAHMHTVDGGDKFSATHPPPAPEPPQAQPVDLAGAEHGAKSPKVNQAQSVAHVADQRDAMTPTSLATAGGGKVSATPPPPPPEPQQAPSMDLAGVWHVAKPPKLDRKVTLTRVDDRHYRLTPASVVFHGLYAWNGKTLAMESGNPGYPDLTWVLTPPVQFVMTTGAYKGATMTREP